LVFIRILPSVIGDATLRFAQVEWETFAQFPATRTVCCAPAFWPRIGRVRSGRCGPAAPRERGGPHEAAAIEHRDMSPYARLPEQEKGKDRNTIRHYPDFAAGAQYRIVRLG